ncbi:MAG TPA: Gfo/Idh/MocA family oxidoreductase [Verrucomicrobiae bacterium]|nr:Gfo/Idh/MocA family oxidoreductase [Verrucomicrobiae bacterium]
MTADRIGVGVVGVGMMGRRHAENAAQWIPGARLAAVFDADRALAGRVGRDLDAGTCGSVEELVGRSDVRVIVIASPSRFHAEQAVAALSRGKDVLLEKPMAHSLADCDRIITAAKQGSARLQIGFMRRYDPAYAEAQGLVASGALGEPLLFRAVHRDREATHLPASSGVTEMMFESTIHDFDLSRFFLGDEIAAVTTTASVLCHTRGEHGHAPNAALNAVRFARGALAEIETYWGALYGYDVRSEIVCETGTAVIGQEQRSGVDVYTAGGAKRRLFGGFLERFAEAYRAELADFVDGALERRPPAVTGRDGRAAVAAALAGVASFESGRPADVAA